MPSKLIELEEGTLLEVDVPDKKAKAISGGAARGTAGGTQAVFLFRGAAARGAQPR